jgi:outer membrane receptor protein involved in Fe transport
MTRSRQRKLRRIEARKCGRNTWRALPVASALLALIHPAHAADTGDTATLEEVVVTAQKRAENLQDVPLSIQAFSTAKLEELRITSFDDYAKFLPSVSFQKVGGPSFEHTYMRGVASGGDGNHSGSQPSVGTYLDEQPVTTIDGNLNIHIYDIERVEALAGPQGTLYGASSQAGTIRIITNKPDPSGFKAGYDVDVNQVDHGGTGYSAQAYVNLPLTDWAAVRLVGWDQHDAGYIDNVHGAVLFPTSGIVFDNSAQVKKNYNTVDTKGGRAALKLDLNDSWTVTPTVMGQTQQTNGDFAYNPAVGDLQVQHWFPDSTHDSWVQSALTVEGKISNFDLVYAGAYLTRNTHEQSDYVDYSLFYDRTYGSGAAFKDNAGNLINPAQTILGRDHYTKLSHELRVSSPKEYPLRFVGGLFLERQVHEILQDYLVDNGDPLGSVAPNDISVPGWPGTVWLTDQERVDRDKAIFGELSYDLTDHLTASAGLRHFTFDNTLQGYYGFNSTFSTHEGVATCFTPLTPFHGAPCSDLDRGTSGAGNTPKYNLTYKFDKERLVYATYSKGFRPGGVNRNGGGTIPPYQSDFLTNYEVGWKTTWDNNRLRFNGAVFVEDWSNFQFSYLGPNALSIITNAGQAQIKGFESDLEYAVTQGLTLSGGFSLLDAKLKQDFCGDPTQCNVPGYEQFAPAGTRLPVTPKFKGNVTARYTFPIGSARGDLQASAVHVGERTSDLRPVAAQALGDEPAYTVADLSGGIEMHGIHYELYVNNAFDTRAVLDRYAECDVVNCGVIAKYNVPNQPRTIGVKFGQKF